MTRTRWLVLGVLAIVAVTTVVLSQRGPAPIAVDTVRATRQPRFVSTVTASGEIVATRYADIGSSVMGKIVSLPVAEGKRVRAGQVLARIDAVQAESEVSSAQAQVLALEAGQRGAREQVRAAAADIAAAEARAAEADQQSSARVKGRSRRRKTSTTEEALTPKMFEDACCNSAELSCAVSSD